MSCYLTQYCDKHESNNRGIRFQHDFKLYHNAIIMLPTGEDSTICQTDRTGHLGDRQKEEEEP
jgi:hypothetical protein